MNKHLKNIIKMIRVGTKTLFIGVLFIICLLVIYLVNYNVYKYGVVDEGYIRAMNIFSWLIYIAFASKLIFYITDEVIGEK